MKELSSYEFEELKKVLDRVEAETYYSKGWKFLNGGYADAEYCNCDDEKVYFEVRHGKQNMGDGESIEYTEDLELERKILQNHELTTREKANHIP